MVTALLLLLQGRGSTNGNQHFGTLIAARSESSKHVPAPAVTEAKPWRTGQWALYKTTNHDVTVSFERIRVIDEEPRVTWIEWIEDTAALRTTWLIALRRGPNPTNDWQVTKRRIEMVVRFTSDDPTPRLWMFEDGHSELTVEELLWSLKHRLEVHTQQALPRGTPDTIDVPAGHFVDAIRSSHYSDEVWTHPDVPLGGLVQSRTHAGGWKQVLVAYGDSDATADDSPLYETLARARETCPANPARCEPPVHTFLALGFGFGRWTKANDVHTGGGHGVTLQLGQRLVPGLHLVEEVHLSYGANAELAETHDSLLIGVRWMPFRGDRHVAGRRPWLAPVDVVSWTSIYVKATVGAADRAWYPHGTDADDSTWAPAVNAALGWLPLQGRAWALGAEYRHQIAWPDGDLQRDWAFVLLTQVSN